MPHTEIDTPVRTVTDPEAERQILVARIYEWATQHHELRKAERMIIGAGLGGYVPSGPRAYTVDLSALRDALPEHARLEMEDGETGSYYVVEKIESLVREHLDAFARKVDDGSVTAQIEQSQPEQIDVAAVLDTWGDIDAPYPQAGNAEIDELRRRTVQAMFKFAVVHGNYCSDLESCFRDIGLESFIPPRSTTVTVELPESFTVEFDLALNRAGETQRSVYQEALAGAIARKLLDSDIQTPQEVTD